MASSTPMPRSSDLNTAINNVANNIPKRGLSHLVSKFETLDKGPAGSAHMPSVPPRQPPRLLPASQTTSSIGSFPDSRPSPEKSNRNNLEKIVSPISSLPIHARSTQLTVKRSAPKHDASQPKMANDKSRRALTVAEKRELFETGTTHAKRTSDAAIPSAGLPNRGFRLDVTPSARTEKSNQRLPISQSCVFPNSTPKNDSPIKTALSPYSVQHHSGQDTLNMMHHSSIHTLPVSSVVLKLHAENDSSQPVTRNHGKPQLQKQAAPKQSTTDTTQVSAAGSPIKRASKLYITTADKIPLPASPIFAANPAGNPLAIIIPTPGPPLAKLDTSCLPITQNVVFEPSNSAATTAKSQLTPLRAKGWSPQRILTPQKPTMSKDMSPMGQGQGEGKFIKPKNPGNFKDAVSFFEAMSNRASLTPTVTSGHDTAKSLGDEMPVSTKPTGKRERFKGSLRKLSSSWRLKQGTSHETAKLLSDYPAMWKVGSINTSPRKKLHAEWCEVSADDKRPLRSSKANEISLFDPYMATSHAKSYRIGGNGEHAHVSVLLQQSSLHGKAPSGQEWDIGTYSSTTDRLYSPSFDCPEVLEPPRRPNRRWFSRSSATLVSQAHCQLEQPRPVHGVELKRLISLCKMQGSMKRRGHSE